MIHVRVAIVMLNVASVLKDDAHLAVKGVGDFAAELLHGGGMLSTALSVVFRGPQAGAIRLGALVWREQLDGGERKHGANGVLWKERLGDDEAVF